MQANLVPFSRGSGPGLPASKRPLRKREQEIVHLVMQGYRNNDIAQILSISELTIDNDLHSIFEKLAVSNRLELALYVMHKQITDQPDPRRPGELLLHLRLGDCLRKAWVRLRRKQGET